MSLAVQLNDERLTAFRDTLSGSILRPGDLHYLLIRLRRPNPDGPRELLVSTPSALSSIARRR